MNEKAVLYVEDDRDDVFFLQKAFGKAGITNPVTVLKDGQDAIEYLAGYGVYADRAVYPVPGLILLDLNLPKKNGFEVLEWIRKQPGFSTTPVLVLSASNQPSDIHTACALGANAYVVKPANPDELLKVALSIKDCWLTQSPLAPNRFPAQDFGSQGVTNVGPRNALPGN